MRRLFAGTNLGMMVMAVAAMSPARPAPADSRVMVRDDPDYWRELNDRLLAASAARRQEQERRDRERIAAAEAKRARRRARNLLVRT